MKHPMIAGVSPVAPGWNEYQILPKEAFLTAIKVTIPSIKGPVTVDLKKTASEYSIGLISPSDTTAIVGIPKRSFSTLNVIKVNDATIWNGTYGGGVNGIAWHGEDADYVKFKTAPGTWKFIALGTLPLRSPKPLPPRLRMTRCSTRNHGPLRPPCWTAHFFSAGPRFRSMSRPPMPLTGIIGPAGAI